ncbi:MAG: SAM-dependent DNA methyltransferase [Candidatus Iainarchaeum archaeon]|uniref:site-specific DNA-methyltransferase (adenine-specific) n=1 Tax=Candidatus Iainarchaeum sp. TaxID=3101447 RepID=A0A7T9DJ03_9ARCH|nr:MAG: SAM-dependent DNA methyltransferase [Candidatus Diapherotrites archaeon]
MLTSELKASLNKLWDKFWAGGLANPLTAIEQISYLIFIKRLEELDNQHVNRAKARNEKFSSVFDGDIVIGGIRYPKNTCRWSQWKHHPADKMMVHVRDVVFPFIKQIHNGGNGDFSQLMKDAAFLIPKPSLLQEAVSILDTINIEAQNYDTLGDLYEYLLSELSSAGKVGQFRTPRHIIRMMVELVDPKIGERICDPACGTAGFLVNAYQYMLKQHTSSDILQIDHDGVTHNLVGDKLSAQQHKKLKNDTFFGYDFDQTMVRIASMNMILHGIEKPNIIQADTLSKAFTSKPTYDVILANPPFTGSIDKNDINDQLRVKTSKTELLFIELFYSLLQIGGKAAVIVPNGVLFGSSNAHQHIRKLLLEKCQLEAVISMPSGVFKPYAGVGTAVLVFTKGDETKNVWFYDMKSDGFTLDDKRNKIDGKGDIPDILEKFKTKAISANSILVPIEKIKENEYNLSISRYQEIPHEEIQYEDPKIIIEKVIQLEKEIQQELEELKRMI